MKLHFFIIASLLRLNGAIQMFRINKDVTLVTPRRVENAKTFRHDSDEGSPIQYQWISLIRGFHALAAVFALGSNNTQTFGGGSFVRGSVVDCCVIGPTLGYIPTIHHPTTFGRVLLLLSLCAIVRSSATSDPFALLLRLGCGKRNEPCLHLLRYLGNMFHQSPSHNPTCQCLSLLSAGSPPSYRSSGRALPFWKLYPSQSNK